MAAARPSESVSWVISAVEQVIVCFTWQMREHHC